MNVTLRSCLTACFFVVSLSATTSAQTPQKKKTFRKELYREYVALHVDSARKYQKKGVYDRQAYFLDKAQKIGETYFKDTNLLQIYHYQIICKKNQGIDATAYIQQSLDFIKRHDLPAKSESEVVYGIGFYYIDVQQYDKAMRYIDQADSMYYEYKRDQGRATVYAANEMYEETLEIALRLLKNAKKAHDVFYISQAYHLICYVYGKQDNLDKALEYARLEYELCKTHKMESIVALHTIATIYSEQKKYDKALELFLQALTEAKRGNRINRIAEVYSAIGEVYMRQGNYAKAINYYESSLEYAVMVPLRKRIQLCNFKLAKLYFKQHNLTRSKELALGVFNSEDYEDVDKLGVSKLLSEIYSAENDSKNALFYLNFYVEQRDTLDARTNKGNMSKLLLKTETHNLSKAYKAAQGKVKQLEQQNSRTAAYYWFFLVSLIIALLVLFVAAKKFSRNKNGLRAHIHKLKNELSASSEKTAVAENALSELSAKFAYYQQIVTEMEERKQTATEDTNLAELLKGGLGTNESMASFMSEFRLQYSDFCIQLFRNHPDLNNTDLKFIAFLKLNLSSNEIASILHITIPGVKKAKARIRQKLNLDANTSLEKYINAHELLVDA